MKNEKKICIMMNSLAKVNERDYFVKLKDTFTDVESINYMFEYLPGESLFWVI